MCILFGKIFQHFWIFLCINLTNPTLVYLLTFGGNSPFLGHNKSFIIAHWVYFRMLDITWLKHFVFKNCLDLETNTESQFPLFWALLDIKWVTSCQWHGGVKSLFEGTLSKTKMDDVLKNRRALEWIGKDWRMQRLQLLPPRNISICPSTDSQKINLR